MGRRSPRGVARHAGMPYSSEPMARVLLVDDEQDIREAVSEALQYEGHDVVTAVDGAEALRACRLSRPDVILLDLMMPGMNGWEFRVAQRREPELSEIPVVVVSALGRVGTIEATAFLPKPFSLEDLLSAVRRFGGPARQPAHA
jgi:CheY-like chemotaxis protein